MTPYDAIYGLYFSFLGYSLRSTQLKSIRTHNDRFCSKLSKNYKAYFFYKQYSFNPLLERLHYTLCPKNAVNVCEIGDLEVLNDSKLIAINYIWVKLSPLIINMVSLRTFSNLLGTFLDKWYDKWALIGQSLYFYLNWNYIEIEAGINVWMKDIIIFGWNLVFPTIVIQTTERLLTVIAPTLCVHYYQAKV